MKTCPVCDTPYPDQHNTCPTDGAVLIETRERSPGDIVRNKYRIVRKLGQGGMGVVYLAEHLMLGGHMALKFLAAELGRNPQFVKRFRNEARAAYQLRHPNIVEVLDLDQEEDGALFIAMEYVTGSSLRAILREAKGPLPPERALNIARGIAAGLEGAHARGAVHRDIKPENILIHMQPDGAEQAKILDFGIAAMTESITNLSRTHGLLLTPEYAAPEQWRGTPSNELDGRTDLYALGGALYEMLCGQTPFRAVNPEGWMFQHLQGVPQPVSVLRPDLARQYPALDAVVMRLLARERERRFPSAQAVSEALALRASPPAARVPDPPRPSPPISAQPLPAPAESSVSDKVPAQLASRPSNQGGTAPKSPRRAGSASQILLLALLTIAVVVAIALAVRDSTPPSAPVPPAFSPSGGTYPGPQAVIVFDTSANTVIHYTTDGTAPTEQSAIYQRPLDNIPSGTTLRAIAVDSNNKFSAETSAVYYWTAASFPPQQPSDTYAQAKSSYDHKQYVSARALFAQGCETGDMKSCNYLGYMYHEGQGGPRDTAKAQAIYQKACDQGTFSSCASLGVLYQDAGNTDEAGRLFTKACNGGVQAGCNLLHSLQAGK